MIFLVYIIFIISRVRPVQSTFKKNNLSSKIFHNLKQLIFYTSQKTNLTQFIFFMFLSIFVVASHGCRSPWLAVIEEGS